MTLSFLHFDLALTENGWEGWKGWVILISYYISGLYFCNEKNDITIELHNASIPNNLTGFNSRFDRFIHSNKLN